MDGDNEYILHSLEVILYNIHKFKPYFNQLQSLKIYKK